MRACSSRRERVFPDGAAEADLQALYRPRPGLPFTEVFLQNGEQRVLWTTFTPQQIDIDVRHPEGRALPAAHPRAVRGERHPHGAARCRGLRHQEARHQLLHVAGDLRSSSTSSPRRRARSASRCWWKSTRTTASRSRSPGASTGSMTSRCRRWCCMRSPRAKPDTCGNGSASGPRNAVTVLDTHDGIGVIDVGADPADRSRSARASCRPRTSTAWSRASITNSRGQSREATGAAASNLDLYQVNCTFYDALGRDERRYLLARAIQFFLPGMPQVYYVGLLAGENDMALLKRTRRGARHQPALLQRRPKSRPPLHRPVVQDLFALIRLRNEHPAFAAGVRAVEARAAHADAALAAWRGLRAAVHRPAHCRLSPGVLARHADRASLALRQPPGPLPVRCLSHPFIHNRLHSRLAIDCSRD